MTALLIGLAILSASLLGLVVGAWLSLEWMRRLRPGREGDLLAELAAVRASEGLHLAALRAQRDLQRSVADPQERGR